MRQKILYRQFENEKKITDLLVAQIAKLTPCLLDIYMMKQELIYKNDSDYQILYFMDCYIQWRSQEGIPNPEHVSKS